MKYDDLSKADQCMVHRYLYYVLNSPIISDQEYDRMERDATEFLDDNHPLFKCGSDIDSSYDDEIKEIARTLK